MFQPVVERYCTHRRSMMSRERNIPSALLCLLFIIVTSSALSQPRWFSLRGGGCHRTFLGVQEFVFNNQSPGMSACVTMETVHVFRSIMLLCIAAILTALTQFFLDFLGVKLKWLRLIRHNAICIIASAILMVITIGLCFYATELMKAQQDKTKVNSTSPVEIDFGVSYYLIIGASITAVITVAASLICRWPSDNGSDGEILLDDCPETFSPPLPHSHTWSNFHNPDISELPPPPPYSP